MNHRVIFSLVMTMAVLFTLGFFILPDTPMNVSDSHVTATTTDGYVTSTTTDGYATATTTDGYATATSTTGYFSGTGGEVCNPCGN